ncbi:hypothetical protein [Aporhodopirellula aestuarii]|uniref:Uncharacterized protein n=1 Tax=Aporhodopirellula aestuarii TaxID=2950107 RepID=A0ABT0UAT6_9BACT|nr:hypothetical protein [Aporhodopirellula aestuarii]MCM2373996.1 hypothetical protein [Aporhodopirellula aestuarii]
MAKMINRRDCVRSAIALAVGGVAGASNRLFPIMSSGARDTHRTPQVKKTNIALGDAPLWSNKQLARLNQRLNLADHACQAVSQTVIDPIRAVFGDARQGIPSFVDAVDGWSSRYRWCYDALPWNQTHTHREYLKFHFRKSVLSPHVLRVGVAQTVSQWHNEIEDIENRLLVDLSTDMELPAHVTEVLCRSGRSELDARDVFSLGQEATTDGVVRSSVQFATSEAIASLAIQLGRTLATRGGILAAGSSGAVVSCGITLLAGLIIDYLVDRLWDWWADPRGKLIQRIRDELRDFESTVLVGVFDRQSGRIHPGVFETLKGWASQRNEARNEEIHRLLRSNNEPA